MQGGGIFSIYGTNITGNLPSNLLNGCKSSTITCCGCNQKLVPNCPATRSCVIP